MTLKEKKNALVNGARQLRKLLELCEKLRALARCEILDAKNAANILEFIAQEQEIELEGE